MRPEDVYKRQVQANAVSETLCYEAGMKQEIAALLVTALTAAVRCV